jgi:hypothetical protein
MDEGLQPCIGPLLGLHRSCFTCTADKHIGHDGATTQGGTQSQGLTHRKNGLRNDSAHIHSRQTLHLSGDSCLERCLAKPHRPHWEGQAGCRCITPLAPAAASPAFASGLHLPVSALQSPRRPANRNQRVMCRCRRRIAITSARTLHADAKGGTAGVAAGFVALSAPCVVCW